VLLFLLIFYNCYSFGQTISLSNAAKSALLLVEQERILLSFGHTAIRVSDAVLGVDVVYNYGAFDFSTPNFVMKFMKDLQYFAVAHPI
jgi:hypothetical protein